jgi:plasmid stabilization system protein ParE
MTHRVVLVAEAEEQFRRAVEWWQANRGDAPTILVDEFEQAAVLLEEMPGIGPRFSRASSPGIRRILLRRSNHWIYYTTDPKHPVVYVLAVWSAFRRADPRLPDPRSLPNEGR